MMRRRRTVCRLRIYGAALWAAFGALSALSPTAADEIDPAKLPPAAQRKIDFGADVLPLLKEHCFACHQGRDAEAGYRLDLRSEILGETNGEPLVVVGQSAKSQLIQLVSGVAADKRMPPPDEGEPLSPEQIGVLRAWIDQGLAWDEKLLPPTDVKAPHWAFVPPDRPPLPEIRNSHWLRTSVDAFIAAEHEARGLVPAAQADRRTLIRRAALDLTGLPPSPEEVREFLEDTSPDAYERLVERLLSSPRYGQRWGRHWLDVARWAESEGYESNHPRPYAWRYRDYVIASFNQDKPYDRFLREQIAGDELLPYRDENLIATGFLAAARLSSNEEDKLLQRNSVLVDITNAVASGVLGLTLGCAQCHNHKFDPLTQRDYYRLQGLFVTGQPNNLTLRDEAAWQAYHAAKPAEYDLAVRLKQSLYEKTREALLAERRQKLSPEMSAAAGVPEVNRTRQQQELARQADLQLQLLVAQVEAAIKPDDRTLYDALKKKIETLDKTLPERPQTWGFYSPASPTPVDVLPMKGFYPLVAKPDELRQARAHLLVRGDEHRRGPEVEPGWPAIFGATPSKIAAGPRSEFVDWLVSPSNPLTARVWVNRVWQQHFGRGLVATPDDFGLKGAAPSHLALLDYLSCELIDSGWSTRHIHRLIMLSSTYRQSSVARSRRDRDDPENHYLARWSPRRLEAETIRDLALFVADELDLTAGGKSAVNDKGGADDGSLRRSVYLFQKRDAPPEVQRLFDGPSASESCARRNVTTVALQPLYLLNSPMMVKRATAFAARVATLAGADRSRQVEAAFELALGRPPDDEERLAAAAFLGSQSEGDEPDTRLVHFCHALMNLNEFVYLR